MASGFGCFFVGHTVPITNSNFQQVDPSHWVLDASSVIPNYGDLKEVALFLLPGASLDPNLALGLYVRAGAGEWAYRGCVHNAQPSAVMPLQWPLGEDGSPISPSPGLAVQIGVSLETGADIIAKENSAVGAKAEFAKRVGLDLFRYLSSYQTQNMGNHIVVPANAVERWYTRFQEKLRRDPDFLTRNEANQ